MHAGRRAFFSAAFILGTMICSGFYRSDGMTRYICLCLIFFAGTTSLSADVELPEVDTVTDKTFDRDVLQKSTPSIVVFTASWCGDCRLVTSALRGIAASIRNGSVLQVNADVSPRLSSQHKVTKLPTVMIFRKGLPTEKKVGVMTGEELTVWLSKELAQGQLCTLALINSCTRSYCGPDLDDRKLKDSLKVIDEMLTRFQLATAEFSTALFEYRKVCRLPKFPPSVFFSLQDKFETAQDLETKIKTEDGFRAIADKAANKDAGCARNINQLVKSRLDEYELYLKELQNTVCSR
jgi:thioredoxin 1